MVMHYTSSHVFYLAIVRRSHGQEKAAKTRQSLRSKADDTTL